MPNYQKYGKIEQPISPEEWAKRMDQGHFVRRKHKGFCATLYYFAVRCSEGLKATKDQFTVNNRDLFFDVGERLKHSKRTPSLNILRELPYVSDIEWAVEHTDTKQKVFPFSRQTGYNVIVRVFPTYPHFFRLNRITQMFNEGWTISEVQNWTGLTLASLNYYVGLANIRRKGRTIR